jgi:hypothetical protein
LASPRVAVRIPQIKLGALAPTFLAKAKTYVWNGRVQEVRLTMATIHVLANEPDRARTAGGLTGTRSSSELMYTVYQVKVKGKVKRKVKTSTDRCRFSCWHPRCDNCGSMQKARGEETTMEAGMMKQPQLVGLGRTKNVSVKRSLQRRSALLFQISKFGHGHAERFTDTFLALPSPNNWRGFIIRISRKVYRSKSQVENPTKTPEYRRINHLLTIQGDGLQPWE